MDRDTLRVVFGLFRLSNSEVMMTTKLQRASTAFLTFHPGNHGAAGNPPRERDHPQMECRIV